MEGGRPQCGCSPSPRFPHCTFSFHNTTIMETSNSIQDLSRWTRLKDPPLLRIQLSPLSLSFSTLNLCSYRGGLGRGRNSPQAPESVRNKFTCQNKRGVWGQCWPWVQGMRNLFLWKELGLRLAKSVTLLLLWNSGEDKDHTFPALRVCGGKHARSWGFIHSCPGGEDSPAHRTHLAWGEGRSVTVCAVTSPSGGGTLCP